MTDTATPAAAAEKHKPGWLGIVTDYGPIVLFFAVYKYYSPSDSEGGLAEIGAVIRATIAFMIGAAVAFAVSLLRFKHVSPMLLLSTAMILFFGGLTVWTQSEFWIMHKPTFVYVFGAVMLLGGWLRGKALFKVLLGAAFEGLDDDGWMKLSRNWGLFFVALAVLNEALVQFLSFGTWAAAKLWLFLPLSFAFTFAHMPMLLRHGLAAEDKDEAEAVTPHE